MLEPSKPLSAAHLRAYHEKEYANSASSYYSQKGQTLGTWHGKLAAELGLTGPISKEHFDRLADGQDPHTGATWIAERHTKAQEHGEAVAHRSAWDLTFNAPKTVSVTAIIGGDERVRQAHYESVTVAADSFEEYCQARMGGDKLPVTTGKWILARFEHDTSRPVGGYPCPHIHSHLVLINMTRDANGQMRSLDTRALFRAQAYATAIYQAELGSRLRQLGYELEIGTNNAPDIAGYSKEYLDAESLRTSQIKQEMSRLGLTGKVAEKIIAHKNREAKIAFTPDELRELHRAHAALYGNQPMSVVEQAQNAYSPAPETVARTATKAVEYARSRLSERESVFEHHQVVRDALRYDTQRLLRFSDVRREIAVQQGAGKFIPVTHYRGHAPGARYTTPEAIQAERAVLQFAKDGREKCLPVLDPTMERADFKSDKLHLNNGQLWASWHILHSTDRLVRLEGRAGVGKTSGVLVNVRDYAQRAGYDVRGVAATSRAVKELNNAHIQSESLQSHIQRPEHGSNRPTFYIVDESSLVATVQLRDFLQSLKRQDRVLVSGDLRQHQSVEAGRISEELEQSGVPTFRVNKIERQRDNPELLKVIQHFSKGETLYGVSALKEQGHIHEEQHRGKRLAAIAEEFVNQLGDTIIISPDNQSRRDLNEVTQAKRREAGHVKAGKFDLPIPVARQELTKADLKRAGAYKEGDMIRYRGASKTLAIRKGDYGTVLTTDRKANLLTVRLRSGREIAYDPHVHYGVSVYKTEARSFSAGDKIQFTQPWKERGIANRDFATITKLDKHGNITVRLLDESGRKVKWNLNRMAHIDLGYAVTSYCVQGATCENAILHIDAGDTKHRQLLDQAFLYVGSSRPTNSLKIFTDNANALERTLGHVNEKTKALSLEQIQEYRPQPELAIAV